jgi:hypothetical protein
VADPTRHCTTREVVHDGKATLPQVQGRGAAECRRWLLRCSRCESPAQRDGQSMMRLLGASTIRLNPKMKAKPTKFATSRHTTVSNLISAIGRIAIKRCLRSSKKPQERIGGQKGQMTGVETHIAHIEKIFGVKIDEDEFLNFKASYGSNSPQEMRKCLYGFRLKQKALRMLKRYINRDAEVIRHEYQNRQAFVGKGFGSFLVTMFVGSKAVGKYNTMTRACIRTDKEADITPCRNLKDYIHELLYELDRVKHEIEFARN